MGTPPSPVAPGLPAGYDPSTGVFPPSEAYHVDFSDIGGKVVHSAHPLLQKYVDAVTVKNPEYEEAELHRIATMPQDDFNKWYASESDPVLRSIGNIASAIARVIPGEAQASEAQTAAQKTKAGKQVGDFVRGQLEHPEQVAMASADAGLPSDFIESLGGRTVSKATPLATVSSGGSGALSSEEIARPETFVKYSKSGTPTYLGKQPDAALKAGEAALAINNRTGEVRVQNTEGLTDAEALRKFKSHIQQNFGPKAKK